MRECVWWHSVSMFCRTLRVALRLRRAKQQGGIQQHRLFVYFIHFSKSSHVYTVHPVCVCLFFLLPNTYFIISSHKSVLYILLRLIEMYSTLRLHMYQIFEFVFFVFVCLTIFFFLSIICISKKVF